MNRISQYEASLREVYNRAMPNDHLNGRTWYSCARHDCYEIAKEHGLPLKRVVFAAAALSNNKTWEENVQLAYHVAFCVKHRVTPSGHFQKLLDKAVRIMREGDFSALSGPKVIPFAAAIWNIRSRAAVVDRWVFRAANGQGYLTECKLRQVQAALTRIAKAVRRPVSEVQAVVWTVIRRENGEG